jgi:hypothetical protein
VIPDGHRPAWWLGLRTGAQEFDACRYWHAHEHWETEWKAHPQLHRHYVKGLIQLAAACHHVQRGGLSAARRLLELGPRHLWENHPLSWPFDTAHLLAVAASMSASLARGQRPRLPALGLTRMMDAWAEDHLPSA